MTEQVSAHTVINDQLAKELNVPAHKVEAAVGLLDGGASVPFIARYRKEVTGGLDDTQLRLLTERLDYLRELHARRAAILESIETQGKLTPELRAQLEAADNKQRLEDLYAPYKPKRRTRAQIAIEAGLEPLADALLADPSLDALAHAAGYLNPELGIATEKAALDGARDILAERFAHDADVVAKLRSFLSAQADIVSTVVPEKAAEGEKFRDYFAHREAIRSTPSHRALALLRGRAAGILSLKLALAEDQEALKPHPCETLIAQVLQLPASAWLADVCRWAWRVKLHPALELEFFSNLRATAETEAIRVFGRNLKDLLLAPPAGAQAVIGLDPGLRTGVKVAVVDPTGKVLATATIFPHAPRNDWHGAIATLAKLARTHGVTLLAIGNGTASRETDRLAADLIKAHPELGLAKAVVSEAGASVYSASALAAEEFPDLDVSLRGAVSIARRLQDPLAELVKIEPKAIGVGQYQHDVNQSQLARALDDVVEDCVNAVGVDVNTASAPLLARVSGLNASLAKALVAWREAHGAFGCRQDLRQVPRLGERAFEQAAGFLRITGGSNPLDASGVHPEAYPVVERILAAAGKPLPALMGQRDVLKRLAPKDFTDERFGLPTVADILAELEKPGRDPRPEFKALAFREGVERLEDLKVGMILDGVVTNVANFGAFVDVGVHQDGLVHISALAERFVKDPHEVVKAGDHVKVKVLEVDIKRQRIALSMRLGDGAPLREAGARSRTGSQPKPPASAATGSAMAQAFANLRR